MRQRYIFPLYEYIYKKKKYFKPTYFIDTLRLPGPVISYKSVILRLIINKLPIE